LAVARRLRVATRRRGLVLLIGADAPLAARIAADGVHLPERMAGTAVALKRTYPGWLITAAAHSARALHAARPADAALLSPVFPSQSRSAGAALGPARAAALARRAPLPVIALGGVTAATARRLRGGFAGLAAIDGVLESLEAER
jgi:thiamine-phosphate pyrophosphorylase